MDRNVSGNSSKQLLYSEYTGTTASSSELILQIKYVAEHVLEKLETKSNKNIRDKSDESFKTKGKSETFERVRKLMSLIDKKQDVSNASTEKPNEFSENKEGIEVVMEVDENSAESNVNAWFMLKLPKEQESKYSDDDELEKNSSSERILDFSDSSDASDDESEKNFPVITNGFALNGIDSSNSFIDKKEVNSSHSLKTIKNSSNFLIDNLSDTSDDELQQNFPIISNGFLLNGTDSSNSVSDEEELNPSDSSKLQNSSNFVNDDSTNSSDVKDNQYLSVSTMNGNLNCEDSGTLQISLPLKNSKRIFEIPDDSSEDLKDEFVKHSTSSCNGVKLSSEKKIKSNFVLNGCSDYSLDKCEQNGTFTNEKKCVEDYSNSSNGTGDVSVLGREKITVSESESSKHLAGNKTTEFSPKKSLELKRKLCVLEDEIPSVSDGAKAKKSLCFTEK